MALEPPIRAAQRRIAVLRAIVRAERRRAEADPHGERNGALGIVAPDTPRDRVSAEIAATFDELEGFLNHLGVAHVAASFEDAARGRLRAVVGDVRRAVERARTGGARWSANLVRSPESFDSLSSLSSIVPMEEDERAAFRLIRQARNEFSHASKTAGAPAIASEDAAAVLSALLGRIRT